jgi:hypothetical protein
LGSGPNPTPSDRPDFRLLQPKILVIGLPAAMGSGRLSGS